MTQKTQDEILTEIKERANKMSQVQKNFLKYIDENTNDESNHQNLTESLKQHKILDDNHQMRQFLHLITEISCNHRRVVNFYDKIEQIIKEMQSEINTLLTNEELFNVFSKNNRLLLFLFSENILKPEINLILRLLNSENSESFQKCFNIPKDPFSDRKKNNVITINDEGIRAEIEKYAKNNEHLCEIIQKDLIDEFISTKTNVNLTLEMTIYETNQFLKEKTPSIIEYSAFCGSAKIFKYACSKNAELTNDLWLYAVHGRNIEIIQELKDQNVDPPFHSFEDPAIELIKCHHNELAELIIDDYLYNEDYNEDDRNIIYLHLLRACLESYNFELIPSRIDNEFNFDSFKNEVFLQLCKNDFYYLVQLILELEDIDINAQTIL